MIKKIDHLVITAENINATIDFYEKLGFEPKQNGDRYELYAGDFKINVHILGKELLPHALNVQCGSGDFCFEIDGDIEHYKNILIENGINLEYDIVKRHGVNGEMNSIYLRDPDGNLIEFSSYK